MKRFRRPRRFSIRRDTKNELEERRFDFRKYRKKGPVKVHYIIWLFIVFAVVIFLIRYLSHFAR